MEQTLWSAGEVNKLKAASSVDVPLPTLNFTLLQDLQLKCIEIHLLFYQSPHSMNTFEMDGLSPGWWRTSNWWWHLSIHHHLHVSSSSLFTCGAVASFSPESWGEHQKGNISEKHQQLHHHPGQEQRNESPTHQLHISALYLPWCSGWCYFSLYQSICPVWMKTSL